MQRTMQTGEFHGTRRGTVRHAGLTLAETEYTPGHRLPLHAHEHPFFSMLVRGSFRERCHREIRDCVPTSLVFYPAHEPHEEAFGERGGRAFHVELGPEWLERLRAEGVRHPSGSTESLAGRRNLLMARLHAAYLSGDGGIELEEIVLELMVEVSEGAATGHERRRPAWLDTVVDMLHAHCCDGVRVTNLADRAGVHPVHLARVFRRHTGCTIAEYVSMLRIEHARRALAEVDRPLSSIAYATGFADQAHFTRRFKALLGVPPGRYRRLVMEA